MKKYLPQFMAIFSHLSPRLASLIAINFFATPIRIPRPVSEMEMYESSRKSTLKNGIAAFEWGEASHPVVMLIHGWNGRGTQLSAFAKELIKQNFRVIALDGPGHGQSAGRQTNPSHYAQFIIDAQKELAPNGVHAVIAHSFGGGCAVLAADRGLKVKSLVLVASPAFYDRVVDFFAKNFGLTPKAHQFFYKRVLKLAQLDPHDLDVGKIGARINLPVLIVHDKDDNAVNFVSAQAINQAWPGSRLLATEGLGHRRILKDPYVIKEVAEFIASIP